MTMPQITGTKPVNTQVLVELLNPNEVLNTTFSIGENAAIETPQAYVLSLGPKVPEDIGFVIGDRVMIHGAIVFSPLKGNNERKLGTIEYHMIKGVLTEQKIDLN